MREFRPGALITIAASVSESKISPAAASATLSM